MTPISLSLSGLIWEAGSKKLINCAGSFHVSQTVEVLDTVSLPLSCSVVVYSCLLFLRRLSVILGELAFCPCIIEMLGRPSSWCHLHIAFLCSRLLEEVWKEEWSLWRTYSETEWSRDRHLSGSRGKSRGPASEKWMFTFYTKFASIYQINKIIA